MAGLLLGSIVIYAALKPIAEVKPSEIKPKVSLNNQKITGYALPIKIDFAGENVPLQRSDVREKLDREIQVNAFWHSSTILHIKRANKWLPAIDSILTKNGVPSDFKYLAVIESGLQNVISPKNAVGFWQFLAGTARDFDLEVTKQIDERYDPIKATEAASKYLLKAHEKFGNWTNVAASYNMGMNGMNKALINQGANSFFDLTLTEEPSRYVFRLLALKEILETPESFGFFIPSKELYTNEKTKVLNVEKSIPDFVAFSLKHGITFQTIKRLNPWIRSNKLNVRSGKKYNLLLPD